MKQTNKQYRKGPQELHIRQAKNICITGTKSLHIRQATKMCESFIPYEDEGVEAKEVRF